MHNWRKIETTEKGAYRSTWEVSPLRIHSPLSRFPPLGIEVRVGRGAWDLGSVARLWASRFSGEGGWDDQEGAASLREGCVASPRWGGSATRV